MDKKIDAFYADHKRFSVPKSVSTAGYGTCHMSADVFVDILNMGIALANRGYTSVCSASSTHGTDAVNRTSDEIADKAFEGFKDDEIPDFDKMKTDYQWLESVIKEYRKRGF